MTSLTSEKTAAASYVASGGNVAYGAATAQEIGVYVGIGIALLTYLTTLYFNKKKERREAEFQKEQLEMQRRRDEREQQMHEKLMSQESFDTTTITELGETE